MIYLDYAATTPCDPEALDAMLPFFRVKFGNASSVDHRPGAEAQRAVEVAREHIARLVDANPEDVTFTSGSTEANNLVLSIDGRVITGATEHPSMLESVLNRGDGNYSKIRVRRDGTVDEEMFRETIAAGGVSLASIMHTNNETGVQNDVVELARIASDRGVFFHSDLTQGVLSGDVSLRKSAIDAVSLSAHKIYGPKGVGALICKPRLRRALSSRMLGGGHERGLRSGTLNVPGIVGFGEAARLAHLRKDEWRVKIKTLTHAFVNSLTGRFNGRVHQNGAAHNNHILSLRLPGTNNRALVRLTVDRLAFALGSACATTKNEPSYVLRAMGLSVDECNETIRVSFGFETTVADVEDAAKAIAESANRLSEMVL